MDSVQGLPSWYELTTPPGGLDRAIAFYGVVFGWDVVDSGMEGFDYRLARAGGDMVAGLLAAQPDTEAPPAWLVYFGVDSADAFVADALADGASVHQPATDIPGTGRYAVLGDPQGAMFGILQPDMSDMSEEALAALAAGGGAFSPTRAGHGAWHELMAGDPVAAFAFYASRFGWTRGEAVDMGESGTYQLFRHHGRDIGGMMGLGESPVSAWLPYFTVDRPVSAVMEAAVADGGRVHHGPMEVPGPAYIAVLQDPAGAWFAVTGLER